MGGGSAKKDETFLFWSTPPVAGAHPAPPSRSAGIFEWIASKHTKNELKGLKQWKKGRATKLLINCLIFFWLIILETLILSTFKQVCIFFDLNVFLKAYHKLSIHIMLTEFYKQKMNRVYHSLLIGRFHTVILSTGADCSIIKVSTSAKLFQLWNVEGTRIQPNYGT